MRAAAAASLRSSLERIAVLQGELRAVHLQAHLEQAAPLSEAQRAAYPALRGYANPSHPGNRRH